MEDIGALINIIIQGIMNTFDYWSNIEFLGTDMLSIMIAFVIANALISLLIVANKTKIKSGGDRK